MKKKIHILQSRAARQTATRLLLCAAAGCAVAGLAHAKKQSALGQEALSAVFSGVHFAKDTDTAPKADTSVLGQPTALKMPELEEIASFQQGAASWYGPGFHNRLTANGERFDMNSMTAAHKTLPFGTFVLVKSEQTGKSVTVRINDRGPYVKGRIIDLSRAAAEHLGMHKSGVLKVALYRVAGKVKKSASIAPAVQ